MSEHATITSRIASLPRAMHWALAAGLFVGLFLIWDTFVGPQVNTWNDAADSIESRVHEIRGVRDIGSTLRRIDDTIIGLGAVEVPNSDESGRDALSNAVVEVLKAHPVIDTSVALRSGGGNLPLEVSRGLVGPEERLRRLNLDVQFEATPEQAMAIIADFESRPDVETISTLRMNKSTNNPGKLRVSLVLEAWVVSKKTRG